MICRWYDELITQINQILRFFLGNRTAIGKDLRFSNYYILPSSPLYLERPEFLRFAILKINMIWILFSILDPRDLHPVDTWIVTVHLAVCYQFWSEFLCIIKSIHFSDLVVFWRQAHTCIPPTGVVDLLALAEGFDPSMYRVTHTLSSDRAQKSNGR